MRTNLNHSSQNINLNEILSDILENGKIKGTQFKVTYSTYNADGGVNVFLKNRKTGEVILKQFFTIDVVLDKAKNKRQVLKSSTESEVTVGISKHIKKCNWKTSVRKYIKKTMTFNEWIVSIHSQGWLFKQLLEEFLTTNTNELKRHVAAF